MTTKTRLARLALALPLALSACESEGPTPNHETDAGGMTGTPVRRPPLYWGAGTAADAEVMPGAQLRCYCDPSPTNPTPQLPSAIAELLVETVAGGEALHTRLTLNPTYADNTYGANAVGWSKGHAFKDLVGSDATALGFHDEAGNAVLVFHLDYLSEDKSSPSGYRSLGVSGGDGRMVSGDPAAILAQSTSMSRNLNERGYGRYTTDSPHTDQSLVADPAAPGWDFRVVYEAWVKTSIFGAGKLGFLNVPYLHVSPSKTGIKQTPLTPCGCPPRAIDGPPLSGGTGGMGGAGGADGGAGTPPPACPSGVATCDGIEGNTCGSGSTCVGSCCVPVIE